MKARGFLMTMKHDLPPQQHVTSSERGGASDVPGAALLGCHMAAIRRRQQTLWPITPALLRLPAEELFGLGGAQA